MLQTILMMRRVPFSVFPSSYRNEQTSETTEVKTDERVTVKEGAEREEYRRRFPNQAPPRQDDRYTREDIRTTEQDRYRERPGRVRREEDVRVYEDDRRDTRIEDDRRDTRVEIDRNR